MQIVNSDRELQDIEIPLNPKKHIVSKTDLKGIITYGNDYFTEISGYSEAELIGQPHNIIRHPDMPRIVFKMGWDSIKSGLPIFAVVKNLAKDGRYYWVVAELDVRRDDMTHEIIGYNAYRVAASKKVVAAIEPLYKKLVEIEKISGMKGSEDYLMGYLEEAGTTYDKYIDSLIGNKGIFKILFSGMKKIFS